MDNLKLLNFIKQIISITCATLLLDICAFGQSFAIFYASDIPVRERQAALEKRLSNIDITVFSRYREFVSELKRSNVDLVIIPAGFTELKKDYTCPFQLMREDKSAEQQLILSIDKKWNLSKMASATLGIYDELGRQQTKEHLQQVLDKGSFRRIKRVSKYEDLISLLLLEDAEYIIIDPMLFNKIQSKINTKFHEVARTKPIPFPKACYKNKFSKSQAQQIINKLDKETLRTLGFSQIRELGK